MNNLILDISAVVIAIAVSYGVFWFKKHKTDLDTKAAKGDALAYSVRILGDLVTNFVYDLKDSNEEGAKKKAEVKTKIKSILADNHLPIPPDSAIDGAIERGVTTMKIAEKEESDKNVKNG